VPSPGLNSPRLKLGRSAELLDQLRAEYDAAERAPLRTVVKQDLVSGWFFLECVEAPEPPVRWGLLAGDAMHNARSSLDHLACRLVELNGQQASARTAFPIWDNEPRTSGEQQRFEQCLKGIRDVHKAGIRRLQPYAMAGTSEAAMLSALRDLDNLDKHQILLPLTVIIGDNTQRVPLFQSVGEDAIVDYRWETGRPVIPGKPVLWYRPRDQRTQVTDVALTGGVRTTYGDTRTGLKQLREIRAYCVGVVESFAPEFA
jgi:hypothetical protein